MQKSERTTAKARRHDGTKAPNPTAEQRRRMIAEAAYYLAERRGFEGGDPQQDWLVAEAQIDRMLHVEVTGGVEETDAYVRLREEFRKVLAQMQDAVDVADLKSAFERGLEEAKRAESFSGEALHKAATALRDEIRGASDRMGPTWELFSERSSGLFSVWKDRSRGFIHRAGRAVRDWMHPEDRGPQH